MIRKISENNIHLIKNKSLQQYAQIHVNIERTTLRNIESFGLSFQKKQLPFAKEKKLEDLKRKGALLRNNNKSVYINRISTACRACQTGVGSYTTFVSLRCHRNCYFCFNPNQGDYEIYKNRQKDIQKELIQMLGSGVKMNHLALTGGEPLLYKKETVDFFKLANQKTPNTYTRLYTTGDLLDEKVLEMLKQVNLNEIRISIKMEDPSKKIDHILKKITLAKDYIPNVLVEMPVIPGTLNEMKQLLVKLDELKIFGINLLEFCFPLGNTNEFSKRGFKLKNPPYDLFYNYWYAGGLAVAESEEACMELVDFAIENKLKLGVHYCSLENKFTGQIYQQNFDQSLDETYLFSNRDYFFKTAKAFGKDIKKVVPILERNNIPYTRNSEFDFVQFPVTEIPLLAKKNIDLAVSSNVVERENGERYIREIALAWTTPDTFELADIINEK